jgi:hypothetical protein
MDYALDLPVADGVYTAATLSKRDWEWGGFWAARGYVACWWIGFTRLSVGLPEGALRRSSIRAENAAEAGDAGEETVRLWARPRHLYGWPD